MKKLASMILLLGCATLALCAGKTQPPERLAAREACQIAMHKAYEWDHAYQLIFVTSRPFDFAFDGRSSRWGFRCVSGDHTQIASFSLDMAHPASPIRVTKDAKRPTQCEDEISYSQWKIDSSEACAIAKRNGLDAWLAAHPTFDPSYSGNRFELAASKSDGPYWLVSCTVKGPGATRKYERFQILISADDGHVLSH